MNPSNTPAAGLLALAGQVLEALSPDGNGAPVTLSGCGVRVTIARDGTTGHDAHASPGGPVGGDTARQILAVLGATSAPIKAVTIASRARLECHTHFRRVLCALVRAGKVRMLAGYRYWPVGRLLPEEADTLPGTGAGPVNGPRLLG